MNNAQQSVNWALANAHSLELSGGFVKTNDIKKGHRYYYPMGGMRLCWTIYEDKLDLQW